MSTDFGTVLERHKPSGELRQFLDPLNPGVYLDHGPARLYGIDEVLELEAKRRGRYLGDDEFQLVVTDGGLIFCRASISFAIAARWRDLELSRPGGRDDGTGRVDLPIEWPGHGRLSFAVSPRLGSNIYRHWLHIREQAGRRSQVTDNSQSDYGLSPIDVGAEDDVETDYPVANWSDSDEWTEVDESSSTAEGSIGDRTASFGAQPWTEPELDLAGGESLVIHPERPMWTEDVDSDTDLDHIPNSDLEPGLDDTDAEAEPGWGSVVDLTSDTGSNGEPAWAPDTDVMATMDPAHLDASSSDGALGNVTDNPVFDPNETIRQPQTIEGFNSESLASLVDEDSVADSVFGLDSPMSDERGAADSGPGIRDTDLAGGTARAPRSEGARTPATSGSTVPGRSGGGWTNSAAVDVDTTLAEIWHRNKVSILAGASLVLLLVVALSSILSRDGGGGVEATAGVSDGEAEISIPARSGTISIPVDEGSTSTTEPRAPLVIEGLTTASDGSSGVGNTAVADTDNQSGADSAELTNGDQSGDVAICHSNYGGCVPVAADVDCVGDGDGPAFLNEPVVVFGEDVYDLDTDDDREACELGQPLSTPPSDS